MKQAKSTSTAAPKTKTRLHILSASYGPADGRKLYDGKVVDYDKRRNETYVPHSRDVLPFLRALMCASQTLFSGESNDFIQEEYDEIDDDVELLWKGQLGPTKSSAIASVTSVSSSRSSFPLMDGRPMNAVFGDPCPGTTKLLHVEYLFRDYVYDDDSDTTCTVRNNDVECTTGKASAKSKGIEGERTEPRSHYHCTISRIFTSTFREHERVVLKRQDPLFPLESVYSGDDGNSNDASNPKPPLHQQMRDDQDTMQDDGHPVIQSVSSPTLPTMELSKSSSLYKQQWKLAPTTSEITLPIILPFLTVRQRAKCQLVCSSWKDIVLEKGIAVVVDINDVGLFPKTANNSSPPATDSSISTAFPSFPNVTQNILSSSPRPSSSSTQQNNIDHQSSRSLLRGLLSHSHSSLEALVLNDFISLQPELDLHPSLPYLRKLQRLDISRIPTITDETLRLVSAHIGRRLEVLYMKGLRLVTNDGIVHLVKSCCNLRVLDVSQVHQLDDNAGIAIGQYLTKLEVFHGKDNYKLTNRSVDLITRNCRNLVQITLWGSIRLTHISFHDEEFADDDSGPTVSATLLPASDIRPQPMKLILLNLWGCHNLTDAAAQHLTSLPHLRSLCVSECHRLTDRFIHGICQSLTQLLHLQLRYVRRITDSSLKSISQCMPWLYSLDVSFCTKLTLEGLSQLLIERCNSLSELRLYSCRNLNIEATNNGREAGIVPVVSGGLQLVRALQSVRNVSVLSFLDLRECQQHDSFSRDATMFKAIVELGFRETLHGLFIKQAFWNDEVRKQLATNVAF
jgi:hypothetical protein